MYSCVIVVENLPVPLDRRVWQEALALKHSGWNVSIICPRTECHSEKWMQLEGIEIYRHSMPNEANGLIGYLIEYSVALFHECRLLAKIYRKKSIDVVHICNPPDLLFINTLPYKLLGARVIFDYHDICPELYVSKFGKKSGLTHSLLGFFEQLSFKIADIVITANDTFRDLAIARGGKHPDDVFTVYSVPDLSRFRVQPRRTQRPGPVVIGYVGVIGKQDGVDNLIRAVISMKQQKPKIDILCRIIGAGPELKALKGLVEDNRAEDLFDFQGFLVGDELLRQLESFDIGVIPDPPDIYNHKISMNKVFEYSATGIPIVSFRLCETMRLLGDAGIYVAEPTPIAMADALQQLVESREYRAVFGEKAARRFATRFEWKKEALNLNAAYERAVMPKARPVAKKFGFDISVNVRFRHSSHGWHYRRGGLDPVKATVTEI
jgi:glycosyltransferase involved in cell wall biosynthesis